MGNRQQAGRRRSQEEEEQHAKESRFEEERKKEDRAQEGGPEEGLAQVGSQEDVPQDIAFAPLTVAVTHDRTLAAPGSFAPTSSGRRAIVPTIAIPAGLCRAGEQARSSLLPHSSGLRRRG
ncbi:MAG TPA: hypothetical protein VHE32_03970 [Rhodanobacteraceae bacterium]|nr:hypothetical protein [Rhodanobacteraceae bacterium]